MRNLKQIFVVVAVAIACFIGAAHADVLSPFKKTLENLFTVNQPGDKAMKVARATYDVAVQGGSIGSHSLGVKLPGKALIRQAYFYVAQQFTDSGSGTVALQCEDAGNIYSATDITGQTVGTVTAGAATGAAAAMVKNIAAPCELTAVVAGAAQTAGKLNLFVEYMVHD